MSYCKKCGNKLEKDEVFCTECGTKVSEKKQQREEVYDGKIHKCPNCGEILKGFEIKCPSCKYELREIEGNSTVKELAKKIEKAETIEQKLDLIRNYYIPNTKEEIYEFFILSAANIQYNEYGINAWFSKLEQAYHKAKISFGKEQEFKYIDELYKKIKRKKVMYTILSDFKKSKLLQSGCVVFLGIMLMVISSFIKDSDSPLAWLSVIGMFVILYGGIFFLTAIDGNRKKEEKEENEDDDNE